MTDKNTPTEEQIEALLTNIRPNPSERYHRIMKNTVWQDNNTEQSTHLIRTLSAVAATVVLVIAIGFFTPLGTIAQEIFSGLFVPASSDNKPVPVRAEIAPTPFDSAIAWQPQEIIDVQAQAPYSVLVPTSLPTGYEFVGATYDANSQMISLNYTLAGENPLYRNLVIKIHPEGSFGADEVGASAIIQPISINGIDGQYVQGWWDKVGTDESGQATVEWNANLGMHRVKWTQDNLVFEVLFQAAYISHPAYFNGGAPEQAGYLTPDDLLSIAESLR